MLKIKKLKPELLNDLTFNDYKKLARPMINAMKKLHDSSKKPVDFFILTNFEFKDKPGKKTTIFIPGKQTAEWKKFLKEKFKEDKRNLMLGSCYVSGTESIQKLNLVPSRGNAKMNIIEKQGKAMFKMVKLAVQLPKGVEEATAATGGRVQNEIPENQGKKGKENTDKEALKAELNALANQLKTIKVDFETVKTIVAKFREQSTGRSDFDQLKKIIANLEAFKKDFNDANPKVQERVKDAFQKVQVQLPKIKSLQLRIRELGKKQKESASASGLDAATLEVLRKEMNKTKTTINRLKQELNLDALLTKLSA